MVRLELRLDHYVVHIYSSNFDGAIALTEAQLRGQPLGGPYSGQLHHAHTSPGEEHLHVYHKNNQIFAINISGTAHDRSHGVRIPNKVAAGIQRVFPHINLPPNNIIESIQLFEELKLLLESAEESD